jgi:hypothetical protein
MTAAEELVAELHRRGIDAHLGQGSTTPACHATINNIEVGVHFDDEPGHGAISWQGNDGRTHRENGDVDAVELADQVIDSVVNPA